MGLPKNLPWKKRANEVWDAEIKYCADLLTPEPLKNKIVELVDKTDASKIEKIYRALNAGFSVFLASAGAYSLNSSMIFTGEGDFLSAVAHCALAACELGFCAWFGKNVFAKLNKKNKKPSDINQTSLSEAQI